MNQIARQRNQVLFELMIVDDVGFIVTGCVIDRTKISWISLAYLCYVKSTDDAKIWNCRLQVINRALFNTISMDS